MSNRAQRRRLAKTMTARDSEERYRDLIEKIDPGIKQTRLESEKKTLSERFLGAYTDANSQSHLSVRHRQAFEEAPEAKDLTAEEIRQLNDLLSRSRAASYRAQLEEIVRLSAEGERQAQLVKEHWAEELERVIGELDTLAKVGVAEKAGEAGA